MTALDAIHYCELKTLLTSSGKEELLRELQTIPVQSSDDEQREKQILDQLVAIIGHLTSDLETEEVLTIATQLLRDVYPSSVQLQSMQTILMDPNQGDGVALSLDDDEPPSFFACFIGRTQMRQLAIAKIQRK